MMSDFFNIHTKENIVLQTKKNVLFYIKKDFIRK